MHFREKCPPRRFNVGSKQTIEMKDCGEISLDSNEQVTFLTLSGKKYDFAAKEWGFYVTPSMNDRLMKEGFKTALVRNREGKIYVLCVDILKTKEFEAYLQKESQEVIQWLHEYHV